MAIVDRIIQQAKLRRTQSQFMKLLYGLWLAIPGRIDHANLARFSGKNEKTFRNWFAKPIDFLVMNSCVVETLQAEAGLGKKLVVAIDASFITKSGKHTPELGKYWGSKAGKAVRGLEVSCCVLIDPEGSCAIPLQALQTPATLEDGTRLDHYATQVESILESIPERLNEQIGYVVGDACHTKKGFVDRVIKAKKHYVGKLRRDANLKYLYDGKPTGKAGRPRQFEGKVKVTNP